MPTLFTRPPKTQGYQETLIFSTELSRSTSGSEVGRRISRCFGSEPAHRIDMTPYGYSARESANIVNQLLGAMRNGDGGVWVPLWGSKTFLTVAADPTDTSLFLPTAEGEFVAGGWLMVMDVNDLSRVDLLEIDSITDSSELALADPVTQTFAVGSVVCPAVFGSLESPASLGFDDLARATGGSGVSFEETHAPSGQGTYTFGGSTYLSVPIYSIEADTTSALQGGPAVDKVVRGEVWNNRTGAEYSPARQEMTFGWTRLLRTRAQRMALVNWFKYCKGALRNFWLRFPGPSFYTSASASSGAATIVLTGNELGTYLGLVGVRRHVWCAVTGHNRGYRLSNPTIIGDGTTLSVTVTPVLAADLPANSALDTLLYSRYVGDEMTFSSSNLGPDVTEAQEVFVEVQRDTPE